MFRNSVVFMMMIKGSVCMMVVVGVSFFKVSVLINSIEFRVLFRLCSISVGLYRL